MLGKRIAALIGAFCLAAVVTAADKPVPVPIANEVAAAQKVDPKDPKKVDPKDVKKADPKDPKKVEGKKLELRDDWPKVKGTLAQIVKVDADKNTADVILEDGKKATLTL